MDPVELSDHLMPMDPRGTPIGASKFHVERLLDGVLRPPFQVP